MKMLLTILSMTIVKPVQSLSKCCAEGDVFYQETMECGPDKVRSHNMTKSVEKFRLFPLSTNFVVHQSFKLSASFLKHFEAKRSEEMKISYFPY